MVLGNLITNHQSPTMRGAAGCMRDARLKALEVQGIPLGSPAFAEYRHTRKHTYNHEMYAAPRE